MDKYKKILRKLRQKMFTYSEKKQIKAGNLINKIKYNKLKIDRIDRRQKLDILFLYE